MLSRNVLFWKCGVLSLATYMGICKKGDNVDIMGMGTIPKRMTHNVTKTKVEESAMLCSMLLTWM
jgi:hypothetical protein